MKISCVFTTKLWCLRKKKSKIREETKNLIFVTEREIEKTNDFLQNKKGSFIFLLEKQENWSAEKKDLFNQEKNNQK